MRPPRRMLGQVDLLAARAAAPAEAPAPAGLDERLAEIAQRLDELRTASPDAEAARALESRLAHVAELIGQLMAGEGQSALTPRLEAIEEHLETTDEYIIEAARQAAEAVVEAYGRNGGSGQDASRAGEIAVISELAEDLRALERLSQKSEERTARAFDAVHDTLVKIAEHLEAIGPLRGEAPHHLPADRDGGDRDRDDWHEEAPGFVDAGGRHGRLPAAGEDARGRGGGRSRGGRRGGAFRRTTASPAPASKHEAEARRGGRVFSPR